MTIFRCSAVAAALAAGFAALPAIAQTAPAAPAGPPVWTLKENTDATTGKKTAFAQIRAADGSGRLIVRCDTIAEPIVSVQYIPKPALPAADSRMVTVTIDEAKAEMANWEFPGAGAYYGEAYSVFVMVDEIVHAKTIRVSTDNAASEVVESLFTGPGSDTMFRQVYATCGFPYQLPPVPVNK
jgi:hypothetical protein